MTEKEIKELEQQVQTCINVNGHCKIRIKGLDDLIESIWATPCTPDDRKKIDDDSSKGEIVRVKLLNHPIAWPDHSWGSEIKAYTNGESISEAFIDDQN